MKKILALMGSPRVNKNTDTAMKAFLKGAENKDHDVEVINIKDLDITDCIDCRHCFETGECIIKDDMQKIYNKFNQVDGIVFASPTFYNSVSGIAKNLIDRTQRYYGIKYGYGRDKVYIKDKIGYFISVGGADFTDYQFTGSNLGMDHFFASINTTKIGSYYISETDQSDVKDRTEILKELEALGQNFFENSKFLIQKID